MALLGALVALPAQALELLELQVASGIEARRPVAQADPFPAGGQVFIYLVVENRGAPQRLRLVWHHDDRFIVADPVRVGTADRWRTWIRRRLRAGDEGTWRVVVEGPGGAVLGEARFSVGVAQPTESEEKSPPVEPVVEADPEFPCRALLNLRTSPLDQPPRYAVVDVRFGEHAEVDHTPGLVQRTERGLELLWPLRREEEAQGAHGRVTRAWDELWSVPLAGGPGSVRLALPATLGPPEAPAAEPHFREENRLEVLSVLGPWLGVQAHLTGRSAAGPFDRSRLITVGNPNDLNVLVGEGLVELAEEAARRGAGALQDRVVGVALHDFRQAAFVAGEEGLEVWARVRCCQQAERPGGLLIRVPLHAAPPPLKPHAADSKGIFHHEGCAVGLSGPRIVARARTRDPLRVVSAPGVVPFALLGVVWVQGPFSLGEVEAATARLMRAP